jgi:hypothetical protein
MQQQLIEQASVKTALAQPPIEAEKPSGTVDEVMPTSGGKEKAGSKKMPPRRQKKNADPAPTPKETHSDQRFGESEKPISGGEDDLSSKPDEDIPLDLNYFQHLLNDAGNRAARSPSVEDKLRSIQSEQEGKLADIANRLKQPAYEIEKIGDIRKDHLKEFVNKENDLLDEHQARTRVLINKLEILLRPAKRQDAVQARRIEGMIDKLKRNDKHLQIETSKRQFPNTRSMRILIEEGLLQLKAQQIGARAPTRDDVTGEFTTFDAYEVMLKNPPGAPQKYADLHAHYLCDASGRPILNMNGEKQYIDRPVFSAAGEFERMGKAIHLKHPEQKGGRGVEASTGTTIHRWTLRLQDLQMMPEAASMLSQ